MARVFQWAAVPGRDDDPGSYRNLKFRTRRVNTLTKWDWVADIRRHRSEYLAGCAAGISFASCDWSTCGMAKQQRHILLGRMLQSGLGAR